ncbi:MAG: prephenate dehydratase [Acidiferrobacterales bacterium]|nr:prephenate dehydratase [Acidiferrobacterales bacterium]
MSKESEKELVRFREIIDKIDAQILTLMNERIGAAQSIAEVKRGDSQPAIYRAEREAQVLRRLKSLNAEQRSAASQNSEIESRLPSRGMEDADIDSLFREIMSITRGSEAQLSVSLLGPAGTFTEAAALQHFGSKIDLRFFPTMDEIFRAAETGKTNFAVVPIENSTEGGVNATLDRLTTTSLSICGEIYLRIHHNLISNTTGSDQIERVYAHPQALGQCRKWLSQNLPKAELVPCSSNAEGVRQAESDPSVGAIAAREAAEKYGLNVVKENIEDEPGNTTRFLVLSERQTPPSGQDKTSLLLAGRNRPGALVHMLKPLGDAAFDMTRLESRPSKSAVWEYVFFVDFKGHCLDQEVASVLAEIQQEAGLYKLLGSYPASD